MNFNWYRETIIASVIAGIFAIIATCLGIWIQHLLSSKTPPQPLVRNPDIVNSILLVGSSTAYKYLDRHAPEVLLATRPKIFVLTGATETGVRVLTETNFHGKNIGKDSFTVLALASRRYELSDFINRRSTDKFFEIKIGSDLLTITLGAKSKTEFKRFFYDQITSITQCNNNKIQQCIPISTIYPLVWSTDKNWSSFIKQKRSPYTIYSTHQGSATRFLFDTQFRTYANSIGDNFDVTQTGWPINLSTFDLNIVNLITDEYPWVALGGQILDIKSLNPFLKKFEDTIKTVNLVNSKNKPIIRGIYLYGRLTDQATAINIKKQHQTGMGYILSSEICLFINALFDTLKPNSNSENKPKNPFKVQQKFLHLSDTTKNICWIKEQLHGNRKIFRAKTTDLNFSNE